MSISRLLTLQGLTGNSGFLTDGDWIESSDQDPTGSIRLIQLADIGDGIFQNRSRRFINAETAVRLRCTMLQPGDVLIARMPDPMGRACVFPNLGQPAITAVDICILRPDLEFAEPEWIAAAINAPSTRSRIAKLAQGATRARVPTAQLRKLTLSVPTLDEQRRTASHLNVQLAAADDARRSAQGRLVDSKRLLQLILETTLAAPMDAVWAKIGDVAKTTSGTTPSRGRKEYWTPPNCTVLLNMT